MDLLKSSKAALWFKLIEGIDGQEFVQAQAPPRVTLRIDYFSLLLKQLTEPLRVMPKDASVQKVVDFMNAYSLSQEDFDTVVELSKFKAHPNTLDGIQPAIKAAMTKAYKEANKYRVVRAADLISLPGLKKAPKKRIAAILEPVDPADNGLPEENGDASVESEDKNASATEDTDETEVDGEAKPKLDLQSDKLKGIQVQLNLKIDEKSNAKKTPSSKLRASGSGRGGKSCRWFL